MRIITRLPARVTAFVTSVVRAPVLCAVVGAAGLISATAKADNWPQWRGPHLDGSTNETHLPAKIDPSKNLLWSTPLSGSSAGTPVVWGDFIFLSALDHNSKDLLAVCVNRKDGKVLWQKKVGVGAVSNRMNDMASPSPITDGTTVWFSYGTGDLAAFDVAGTALWSRNITKDYGPFNMQWIYAASPLLSGGKLYIPVLHRDVPPSGPAPAGGAKAESFILCVDPQTGKDLWRVVRPTDAVAESREAYTTPTTIEVNGKTQIVISGADYVTGHDAIDGHELWRSPTWNPASDQKGKIGHWRTVVSATTGAGLVFACPPKGGQFFAVKPTAGDSAEAAIVWKTADATTDVCVPLFYDGSVYVLNGDRKGSLTCLDPATGSKKWAADIGSRKVFRASPTGADGKIYCINEAGDLWVLSAKDGQIVGQATLGSEGGTTRSSVVISSGAVIIRTADRLCAFGDAVK